MTTYQGVLHFHSETGTEGGYWAFQDAQFMNLPAPNQYRCTRCGRVWDKDQTAEEPKPHFTYYRPGYEENGVRCMGGDFGSDEPIPDDVPLARESDSFSAEFHRRRNAIAQVCYEQGHAGWEHMYPNGTWSYEGLHHLGDSDVLTVWDGDQVLFHGVVRLPPEQDPYAGGAYVAGGIYTAHRRPPIGTDEDWWFSQKQATLTQGEVVSS